VVVLSYHGFASSRRLQTLICFHCLRKTWKCVQWEGSGLNAHGGKRRTNRQQVFSRALKTRVTSSLLKSSVWSTKKRQYGKLRKFGLSVYS